MLRYLLFFSIWFIIIFILLLVVGAGRGAVFELAFWAALQAFAVSVMTFFLRVVLPRDWIALEIWAGCYARSVLLEQEFKNGKETEWMIVDALVMVGRSRA